MTHTSGSSHHPPGVHGQPSLPATQPASVVAVSSFAVSESLALAVSLSPVVLSSVAVSLASAVAVAVAAAVVNVAVEGVSSSPTLHAVARRGLRTMANRRSAADASTDEILILIKP